MNYWKHNGTAYWCALQCTYTYNNCIRRSYGTYVHIVHTLHTHFNAVIADKGDMSVILYRCKLTLYVVILLKYNL